MAKRICINFFNDTSDGHSCGLIYSAILGAGGGCWQPYNRAGVVRDWNDGNVVTAKRIRINFFDDMSDGHCCGLICGAMLGAGGGCWQPNNRAGVTHG